MRKFLIILDDSAECLNAMRYAARRATRTGAGVQILGIVPPEEYQHWVGVGDLIYAEACARIQADFDECAKWMRDRQGIEPELVIRRGDAATEILAQIADDPEIGILVLGAGVDKSGPGPLVTSMSRNSGHLPIPMTIVPGNLDKDQIDAIT